MVQQGTSPVGEETFERIWARVDPEGRSPVELVPARPPAVCPGEALGQVMEELWRHGGRYRALARRSRRSCGALTELSRRKLAQGRRLAAACFFMTGVRRLPPPALPEWRGSLLGGLREQFFAEEALCRRLQTLWTGTEDPYVGELLEELLRETREMARTLRTLVEKEC